jgi:hypothetical protein
MAMSENSESVQFKCRGFTPDGRPALREKKAADVTVVISIEEAQRICSEVQCPFFKEGRCTASHLKGHWMDQEYAACPHAYDYRANEDPADWQPPEVQREGFGRVRKKLS